MAPMPTHHAKTDHVWVSLAASFTRPFFFASTIDPNRPMLASFVVKTGGHMCKMKHGNEQHKHVGHSKLPDMTDSSWIMWSCFATLKKQQETSKKHTRDKKKTHNKTRKIYT